MKYITTKNRTIVLALASLLMFCVMAAVLPVAAGELAPKYRWTGETVADERVSLRTNVYHTGKTA